MAEYQENNNDQLMFEIELENNVAQTHTTPATANNSCMLDLTSEQIMPGIFFTKDFIAWNETNLRAHQFTHIIVIDKHIQELYYPSPFFKSAAHTLPDDKYVDVDGGANGGFSGEHFTPTIQATTAALKFGADFEAIDLNFGEKSYLTTVLPNCYRAVRFIRKAQQKTNGKILIIDCNGGEQKCVTIVVAYLMYKHNSGFRDAFGRLKQYYKKADLDRFYSNQLYEYEPILQVHRAISCGHSCSRALRAALFKRKRNDDADILNPLTQFNPNVDKHMNENNENSFQPYKLQQEHQISKQQQQVYEHDVVME